MHNNHQQYLILIFRDEFSENFGMAFDPPAPFSGNHIAIFCLQKLMTEIYEKKVINDLNMYDQI